MKKLFSSLLTIALPFMVNAQDCTIPDAFPPITGSNLTVLFQPTSLVDIPNTSGNGYFIASAPHMAVGRAFLTEAKSNGALTLKVWGDDLETGATNMHTDSTTVRIEGANEDDAISIQYVDGTALYDVDFSDSITYKTNLLKVYIDVPTLTLCTQSTGGPTYALHTDFDFIPPVTDANHSVVFNAGTLSDYVGGSIIAYVGTQPVSEASLISSDGSGGLAVIGNDSGCNNGSVNGLACAMASPGDKITFAIGGYSEEMIPFKIDPDLSFSNGGFNISSAISFEIGTPITVNLNSGWNMVGYVGSELDLSIENSINAALPDGSNATIQETFDIIKNVSGKFWSQGFQMITDFIPGEGYMMKVKAGQSTSLNFQKVDGFQTDIDYDVTPGWNMVAYTGDVDSELSIVNSINGAFPVGSSATIQETFDIIKNVSGKFWSQGFQMITDFIPGHAYMMKVKPGHSTNLKFSN